VKGAGRALDQLDRALASAADHIAAGDEPETLFWIGEARIAAASIRAWIDLQPDHTI
jgi:hypothetical protein